MGVEYYYMLQSKFDQISVRVAQFMEEFETKINDLASRANQRTTDILLDEATANAQLCENIFQSGEPNSACVP